MALGTLKESLATSSQKKLERERAGACRTLPAQGRPASGTAYTAPAPRVSPPKQERRRAVTAGDRAPLNQKRRMRKDRTTAQKLTKQKVSGAAAPMGAPAGPKEPPVRNDTEEAPATSSQAPAAVKTGCEAMNTPDAPSEAGPSDQPTDKQACQGRLSGLRQVVPRTRKPPSPERPPRMAPVGAMPPVQTC